MKKNKGMKIYKQRRKKHGSNSQILSILGTCAVVFGVGIFGYYVVAVPVYDLVKSMDEPEKTVSEDTPVVTEEYTETPVTTYKSFFDDSESTVKTENPVTTVVTDKEPASTTVTSEGGNVSVTEAVTETETNTPAPSATVKGGCYYLSVSDISSLSALNEKLDTITGCTSVAVPLKTTGGKVNYASSVSTASLSGAVSSDITLEEIVNAVTEKGMTPVAEFSTVADNIYPRTYKKSAYQFDDGYTGEWLDNRAEDGGKPWLSPFSSETSEYLCSLVDEITSAGIKTVICTDNYFPPFREKDLGYIGEIVKSETRYKGLTDLVNKLNDSAASNGGKTMLSVSAAEIFNSSAEVFKPEEFGSMPVVVTINMNELSEESVSAVLKKLDGMTGGMKLVPCLVTEGQNETWVESSVNTFKAMGYDIYMIK